MAQQNVREIISAIKKGNPEPVYILMGDEPYFIDLIIENIEKYTIDPADRDFNCDVFYGNDADLDYVMGAAKQFPVMAPRKLVILKEAQARQNAKQSLERLAPYIENPNMTTVFVLAFKGDSLNANSEVLKAAKKSDAVVFKSNMIRDWQLPAQVKDYCSARKIGIEDKAVQLLCDYIGNPLSKLFGELNKLIDIKGEKKERITCDDIERNIGISKDYNNYELVNALQARDYPKTIRIVDYFQNNPKSNPTIMTTAVIVTFFSNILAAHYLPDKSESAMMAAFGFKWQGQLNGLREGMRAYNPMQALNAIHYIREFDTHSKGIGSLQNEYDLLKEMIFKIFT